METEKIFKTKSGFCHILPGKIVLTRDGIVGNLSEIVVGNNIKRIQITYSILAVFLVYFAYKTYLTGGVIELIISFGLASYLVSGVINSQTLSATPVIDRNKIKLVQFKKGINGITRSRFEILFEDTDGKLKKQLIMLPGSLNNGSYATALAVKIMKEEGLL
ncbi:MAG: hypothetical protein LUH15_14230 [Tannerellaceae bacterium]|nr:hypothetical protein [Tannerellaceae bacterium]